MNVVITGSTKGIGFALAEEFIKNGHSVLINGRTRETCANLVAQLRVKHPKSNIHLYACDVTNYSSVDRMFLEAKRFFGSVDIWINNAGMSQNRDYFYNHDISVLDKLIDLNLKSVMYGTEIASRYMMETGGFIYNMEGYGSDNMMSNFMTYYGTTKRALRYFTQSASKEIANSKIKIGTLSPGMVVTDLLISGLPTNKNDREKIIRIYNILADKPETVSKFLVKKMLLNSSNGASIKWLTNLKVTMRFFKSIFIKRNLFSQ